MRFKIEIEIDNDAFQPRPEKEVKRILHEVVARIDRVGVHDAAGKIMDENGNSVGYVKVMT